MSVYVPNGSTFSIADGYAASVPITALSNANPAVATATQSYSAGDFVEITSNWSRLNDKIVRVAAPTGSTFELDGYNTSSTTIYPVGSGTGSSRKITGWTQLLQVTDTASEGGDQQYVTFQFLEGGGARRLPTDKDAAGLRITLADDRNLAWYALASEANDDRLPRAVRLDLAGGGVVLYNCYIALNKTPRLAVNTIATVELSLSFLNSDPVRY